jgi:hypothetical protein
MKLTELEPQFECYGRRDGHDILRHVDSLEEAQGIQFLCPSCFVRHGGSVGTHWVEVSFAGRSVEEKQGSHNRDGQPSRWNVSGTGYSDLTTTPSILIDPAEPACSGWHGFITNGEIT